MRSLDHAQLDKAPGKRDILQGIAISTVVATLKKSKNEEYNVRFLVNFVLFNTTLCDPSF